MSETPTTETKKTVIHGIAVGTLMRGKSLFETEPDATDAPPIAKVKESLKRKYGSMSIDVRRVPRRIWRIRQLELEALEAEVTESQSVKLPPKERAEKINAAVEVLRNRTIEILCEEHDLPGGPGSVLGRVYGVEVERDGTDVDVSTLPLRSALEELNEMDLLEIVAGAVNRHQQPTRAQKN
jgi:hypothetical protein